MTTNITINNELVSKLTRTLNIPAHDGSCPPLGSVTTICGVDFVVATVVVVVVLGVELEVTGT